MEGQGVDEARWPDPPHNPPLLHAQVDPGAGDLAVVWGRDGYSVWGVPPPPPPLRPPPMTMTKFGRPIWPIFTTVDR